MLHITPSYKPAYVYGGPIYSVSRLCESQLAAGAEVQVWTTTANGAEELQVPIAQEQQVDGVGVTYFRRWTKDHSHFSPALLMHLLQQGSRFDHIHIHSWWNLVAIGSVLVCRLKGIRPVVSPRGMLSTYTLRSKSKRFFHQWIGRWLLSGTSVHATTVAEAREVEQLVPGADCFVLPNVVELPERREADPRLSSGFAEQFPDKIVRTGLKEQASRTDHFDLLFLSRIHPKKGLDLLFRALAAIDFSWKLTIAGEGEEAYVEELQQLATDLAIDQHLHWYGWADQTAKFALLREADLFVLTSHNENFANVVLEALAVGTPVLLSDRVGLADWVQQAELGWVSPLEVTAIIATLQAAAEASEQRQRIRHQAPAIVHQTYDARTVAQQYLSAYSSVKQPKQVTLKSPPREGDLGGA